MDENKNKEEYPAEDIEILELGDSTSKFIEDFECSIKEIEKFLKEDALNQAKESVNTTFLWMSRENKKIIGYITLCADAIRLDGVQKDEMEKKKIRYKSLPALKICRMGVRKDLRAKGIGRKMIFFAIKKALKINTISACRFITLDSKNDEEIPEQDKPFRFYKKLDFIELKTKEKKKNIHMYRDLINIIKEESKI